MGRHFGYFSGGAVVGSFTGMLGLLAGGSLRYSRQGIGRKAIPEQACPEAYPLHSVVHSAGTHPLLTAKLSGNLHAQQS